MRRARFFWVIAAATGAFGCQAILGIDDTTFHDSSSDDAGPGDGGPGDGATSDSGPTDAGSDSHVDVDAGEALVSISPSRVLVHQNGTVGLAVTVTRSGYAGPVVVALADVGDAGATPDGGADGGGANGVGAPTLTIPAGQTSGTIVLSASATAPVGLTSATFAITTSTSSSITLPVMVAGPTGTLDTTFGTGGTIADAPSQSLVQVVVDENDTPWVIGNSGWYVHHYDGAGTADSATNSAFASALTDLGGNVGRIAVKSGSVFVGGTDGSGSFAIRKLSTAGVVYTSFAGAGTFHAQVGSNPTAGGSVSGLVVDSTGTIYASGYITAQSGFGAVFRIDKSGNSSTQYRFNAQTKPQGVALLSGGRAVTGGTFTTADAGTILFATAFDGTFADAGTSYNGSPARIYTANDLVLTADGRLVVGGTENYHIEGVLAVFDPTNANPIAFYDYFHNGTWDQGFAGMSSLANGDVVVTNVSGGSQTRTAYAHSYGPDGGLNSDFNWSVSSAGGKPDADFNSTAVDSWGRVYIAGDIFGVGAYLARVWQ